MTSRQLFYLSRAATALSDDEIRQILRISQRNNRQRDITGCLLFSGRHFAQVLEGSPEAVDDVLGRIERDRRHTDLAVVIDRMVAARRFPNWSMGMLYKLDTSDRIEQLLSDEAPDRALVEDLFGDVNPDSVMGTL